MNAVIIPPACVLLEVLSDEVLSTFRSWAQNVRLDASVRSRYAPDRKEAWFRNSVHLGSYQIDQHPDPPDHILPLCDRLLPVWHSGLLCGGNTAIGPHRDAAPFDDDAVLINLGAAEFHSWPQQNINTHCIKDSMQDGGVYAIKVKTLHAAQPLSAGRMSFTLRRIKSLILANPQGSLYDQLMKR